MRRRVDPLVVAVAIALTSEFAIGVVCRRWLSPNGLLGAVAWAALLLAFPSVLVVETLVRDAERGGQARSAVFGALAAMWACVWLRSALPSLALYDAEHVILIFGPVMLAAGLSGAVLHASLAFVWRPVTAPLRRARRAPSDEAVDEAFAMVGWWSLYLLSIAVILVRIGSGTIAPFVAPALLCLVVLRIASLRRSRRRSLVTAILRGDHPHWRIVDPPPSTALPWWLREPSCQTIAVAPRSANTDGYRDDPRAAVALTSVVRIGDELRIPHEGRSLFASLGAIWAKRGDGT